MFWVTSLLLPGFYTGFQLRAEVENGAKSDAPYLRNSGGRFGRAIGKDARGARADGVGRMMVSFCGPISRGFTPGCNIVSLRPSGGENVQGAKKF
jgi:hypothetical protein